LTPNKIANLHEKKEKKDYLSIKNTKMFMNVAEKMKNNS